MIKKLKTTPISSSLVRHLGTATEYLDEAMDIAKKMVLFVDKEISELTEEEKATLKRSSELVVLIETTMTLEGMK